MHKILVIRLYFPLDALNVSDYVSPSSGATFYKSTSYFVYAGTSCCRVAVATQQQDVPAYTGIYQIRCTAYKMLSLMMD